MRQGLFLSLSLLAVACSSRAATITVYDAEPATKDIALAGGDVLEVRGNGLTANCSVTVSATYTSPATIRFYETATVAAPISVTDSVEFKVEDGKTVTIAGKLTATAAHEDAIIGVSSGTGSLISFTGGAELAGKGLYTSFRMRKGEAEISGNDFNTTYSLSFLGGYLKLTDGASWTAGTKNGAGLILGRSDQTLDATFEIGANCSATFGNNQQVYLGCASGKKSRLYINGGTLKLTTADRFYFNYTTGNGATGSGYAELEIDNGGVLDTLRSLTIGSTDPEKAKIILGKGTWKSLPNAYLVDHNAKSKAVACDFFLTGDFLFDGSTFYYSRITDAREASGTSRADVRWFTDAEGACLRLNGKSASASNNSFTFGNLSTEHTLALGLQETRGCSLILTNAAANLSFAATLPFTNQVYVTATGTAPALTVDVTYAAASATPETLSTDLLSASFKGFARFAFGSSLAVDTAADGTLYVAPSWMAGFDDVTVSSGTLVLDDAASIPDGVKVETSGTGALALVDATGFVADDKMSGTKATTDITGDLVITATARTGLVEVGNKQTLYVYGDGLGASSAVMMYANSTLKFMADATIAGSVTSTNGITQIATAPGVTGTIAGAYANVCTNQSATIRLNSQGLINFVGGGAIASGYVDTKRSQTYLAILSGAVQITNRPFFAGCSLYFVKGSLRIAEGGAWTASSQYAHICMDQEQEGDATFEIGTGGTVTIGNNCLAFLGNNTYATYGQRLFINGGTFVREGADPFYLAGNGCLEIDNGGRFATSRSISVDSTTGTAKVILRNGSWDGDNGYTYKNSYSSLFVQKTAGTGTCAVSLEGDFTIDLNHFAYACISNTIGNAATWSAKPGARLNLVGDPTGKATEEFRFYNFTGEGLAVDLNATRNTDVAFCSDGRAIDVGFVLPGIASSRIMSRGVASPLNVGYVVPAGLEHALTDTKVYEVSAGFSSVTHTNLTYDAGSTMSFPFATGLAPTAVAGTLTLPAAPAAMNVKIVRAGPIDATEGAVVVTADAIAGNPVWSSISGLRADRTHLTVSGNTLTLDYRPMGAVLILR